MLKVLTGSSCSQLNGEKIRDGCCGRSCTATTSCRAANIAAMLRSRLAISISRDPCPSQAQAALCTLALLNQPNSPSIPFNSLRSLGVWVHQTSAPKDASYRANHQRLLDEELHITESLLNHGIQGRLAARASQRATKEEEVEIRFVAVKVASVRVPWLVPSRARQSRASSPNLLFAITSSNSDATNINNTTLA